MYKRQAIVHAKEVAEKNYRGADFESIDYIDDDIKTNCIKCAEEHMQLAEWLEELKSYKEAEEQGLLVRLPCPVGTTVWDICGMDIRENVVCGLECGKDVYKRQPNGFSGCHCYGTMSYLLDGTTMVYYQVDKEYDLSLIHI